MKIETKFSIGDTVHFIDDNRLQQATVAKINIQITYCGHLRENHIDTRADISYSLVRNKGLVDGPTFAERFLFPSKEALVNNLYERD